MKYIRAKWTRYGDHVAKAKGKHNSNFFGGPLQFELSEFHCTQFNLHWFTLTATPHARGLF